MLPPVPSGIGHIEVRWAVGTVAGKEISNGFWVYSPALEAQGAANLQALLGDFLLTPLGDLLSLVPNDVACSVLRLSVYGATPLTVILPGPLAFGAGGSAAALNSALVLSWRSALAGQRSRSTTWLPLPMDDVDDNRVQLTTSAYGSAQGTAFAFLNNVNALSVGSGSPVELVTLNRRSSAGDLPVASFSPIVYGHPSRFVGSLDRRVRSRGRSPSI